jgi:hypothetical protein
VGGFAISQLLPRPAHILAGASFVALSVPVTALLVPRFARFRTLEGGARQPRSDRPATAAKSHAFGALS